MNPPHPATRQSAAPAHPRSRQRPGNTAKAGPSCSKGQMRHLACCQPAAGGAHAPSRSAMHGQYEACDAGHGQHGQAPAAHPAVRRPAAPQLTPEQAVTAASSASWWAPPCLVPRLGVMRPRPTAGPRTGTRDRVVFVGCARSLSSSAGPGGGERGLPSVGSDDPRSAYLASARHAALLRLSIRSAERKNEAQIHPKHQ